MVNQSVQGKNYGRNNYIEWKAPVELLYWNFIYIYTFELFNKRQY